MGSIGLLIAAFRVSAMWGLMSFLLWPVSLLFVVLHWDVAKNPFLLLLAGAALIFVGMPTS